MTVAQTHNPDGELAMRAGKRWQALGASCCVAALTAMTSLATAAVSPVVGQAGFNCSARLCGDLVSASDGYITPFTVSTFAGSVPYKPVVYGVEVPRLDPPRDNRPVPFDLRFFDLGIERRTGGGEFGDICGPLQNPNCDTPTLVRIFPPPTSRCDGSKTGEFVDFAVSPGGNCSALGVSNCDDLNQKELVISATPDADRLDLGDLGLSDTCIAAGIWRVEVHTGEYAGAYLSGTFDDIDVYRFAATQRPFGNNSCASPVPIKVFTSTLNLAFAQGVQEAVVQGFAWADVRGGWSVVVDTSGTAGLPQAEDPLRALLPPGALAPLSLGAFPSQDFITLDTPAGNLRRTRVPTCYLSDTDTCTKGGTTEEPGYPVNVTTVDNQGSWGLGFQADPETPIMSVTLRVQRELDSAPVAAFPWLNRVTYQGDPRIELFPNALPLYLPFAKEELENPCGGLNSFSFTAPDPRDQQIDPDAQNLAAKPQVFHRARGLGVGPDPVDVNPGDPVLRCYEQELRVVVPSQVDGTIENLNLSVVLPDEPNLKFLRFSDCSTNIDPAGQLTAGTSPGGTRCLNSTTDDATPFAGKSTLVPCPRDQAEFAQLPGTGAFEVSFRSRDGAEGRLSAGDVAFVRYGFAVLTPKGTPVFFNERTPLKDFNRPAGAPLGNRASWIDENADPNQLPSGNPGLPPPTDRRVGEIVQQSLSYGGGNNGSGGTSTSGDGSDDPNQLASIDSIRGVEGPDGTRILEFTTGGEILTGGFAVEVSDEPGDWRVLAPFLPSSPGRIGGLYRIALPPDLSASFDVRLIEHELTGSTRRHGPYELVFESVAVAPSLDDQGILAIDRPQLTTSLAPLELRSASIEPTDRARFRVTEAGGYRIPYTTLASALNASAPELAARASSGDLQLSRNGTSVTYEPAADGILFWAEGEEGAGSTPSSYVISLAPGRRALFADGMDVVQSAVTRASTELLFERDLAPAPGTQTFYGDDYMMWKALRAGAGDAALLVHPFDAPNASGDDVEITLAVRGGSASDRFPDHGLQVRLNGELVGNVTFYGFDDRRFTLPVQPGILQPAGNVLEIESFLAPELAFAVEWIDWLAVRYRRDTLAEDDRIILTPSGEGTIAVTGFTSPNVRAWRINRGEISSTLPVEVTEDGNQYAASLPNGYVERNEIFAFVPASLPVIGELEPVGGDRVRDFSAGAEYVVVAHPALRSGAEAFARYREEQGLSVAIFTVDELYDAFTEGLQDADALRRFLADAEQRWAIRPNYLLIVGDGSFDLENAMSHNDNLVPTQLRSTELGFFGSDTGLGDVGGPLGLEIAVGRVPAHDNDEVLRFLEKVRTFESASGTLGSESLLLVADNPDEAGDFDLSLRESADALRDDLSLETVRLTPSNFDDARAQLLNALSDGTRFMSYIGHGGILGLAGEGLLTRDDVGNLRNENSPLVLLAATCLVGRFEVPGLRTFAESMLLDGKDGAVAVFASAALETNAQSTLLTRSLSNALAQRGTKRLGAAVRDASQLARSSGLRPQALELHTLLGDPALVLWPHADEAALRPRPLPPPVDPIIEAPRTGTMDPADPRVEGPPGPRTTGCAALPPSVIVIMAFFLLWRRRSRRE